MVQRVLADLVLAAHLGFILFAVAGALLALRWRWAPVIHLPAVIWGVGIEVSGGICPLTPLESSLRRAAGESGYAESFIEHYLLPLLYPAALSEPIQWILASLLVLANAVLYAVVFFRRRDGTRRPVGSSNPRTRS
jgi:hypothetical protein